MPDHFLQRVVRALKAAAIGDLVIYRRLEDDCAIVVRVAERWPLIVLVLTVVLTIFLPARIWLVMAAGLGLTVAICLAWALAGARQVKLVRSLRYTWVQVGDRLEEIFTLYNYASIPVLVVEIQDHSDLPGYNASTLRSVAGTSTEKWRRKAISQQRGVFHLGPTTLRLGDPLGLFDVTCNYSYVREVLVFPPVIHDLAVLVPAGGGQGATASRHRKLVETPALGGVRDYHPGDPIRRIHWPLSVRHQALLIKEFDDEKGGDVWLALDLDPSVHAGQGQQSTLEYAIIWTASWAWHLLRQGKGVGLYTRGPQPIVIPPHRGTAHLWHILRALAPLEARADVPLEVLLDEVKPMLARGHSLIVVTPSVSPGWPIRLMMPGLRTATKGVVLLDPGSFRETGVLSSSADPVSALSGSGDGALAGTRSLLSSLGLPVTLVQPRADLSTKPVAPGTGDWDYLTTPWGKVIVRATPTEVKS